MLKTTITAVLLTACVAVVAPAQEAADDFTVGVCTHFVQRKGLLEENIRLMKQAGVESIRDEVPWSQVEREKGVLEVPERVDAYVDAALAEGIEVVLVLDYGNRFYEKGKKPKEPESIAAFVNYASFIVEHFKGRVQTYEIWNEWDIGIGTATGEKGTPEGYMALLKPTYAALKQIDPEATYIGGAVSPHGLNTPFFAKLAELGIADHCDVVSVHPYIYATQPKEKSTPEACFDRLMSFDKLLRDANDGEPVPMLVTEVGWPTHVGPGSSNPQQSADHLARMYLLTATVPHFDGLWWYDFQDDGWDPKYNEDNFGMVRPDLTPKPAYHAFQSIAAFLDGATFSERYDVEDASVYVMRFAAADGTPRLAAWTTGQPRELIFDALAEPGEVTVAHVGRPGVRRQWINRNWVGAPKNQAEPGFSLVVTSTPILLTFDAPADVPAPTLRPAR